MDPIPKARIRELRQAAKQYVKRHDYLGLYRFLEEVLRLPETDLVRRKVAAYVRMFLREIEG